MRSPSRPVRLAAGIASFLLLASLIPGAAHAVVPFRPDVLNRLRADGSLPGIIAGFQDAQARGLGTPPATARGWLRDLTDEGAGRIIPDRNAIVLLVDFSDKVANQILYPQEHYEDLLFSVGTFPGGSMRDWYLENSYGQFNVTGQASAWLRMPQTYAYYVDGQAGFGAYPHNAQKLAEDAVVAADPFIDFSQYDNDGPDGVPSSGDDDGYVDALFIVHAGPGRETTGSDNDIHSHSWAMANAQTVDGVIAYGYTTEPDEGQRGVFGHEFGHALGLPDLYDTDYSSSGVGDWCMMSFGSWGGGGAMPVHFMGWCKSQLGFVNRIEPLTNLPGAALPQVETNPTVYGLWTGGYPDRQYFVVENRQRVGTDVSLPGGGLLICHIDENVSDNTDENHPLVAVEQADGLNELANGGGSDTGDPWPGSTNNRNFTTASTPNSRDYDGNPSQVAVRSVSNSGPAMTANLEVENAPIVVLQNYAIQEVSGNGDGDIDAGETFDLPVTLFNRGSQANNVNGTLSTTTPDVTVTVPQSNYGTIAPESQALGAPAFRAALSGNPTTDGLTFNIQVRSGLIILTNVALIVGVNDPLEAFRWEHDNVTTGFGDQWHLSTQRNHTPGGSYSWKCGKQGAGNYNDRLDAGLVTRSLPLASVDAVSFWHWIDAEDDVDNTAWDGGIVEASIDGGAWFQLTPDGGYPYTIIPNPDSPFAGGTPCFSGTFDWSEVRVDLTALAGNQVRLRFRFGSDGFVTQEGWYLDDFTIEGSLTSDAAEPEAIPTTLRLDAPRPNPARGTVTVRFAAPGTGSSRLDVFDVTGRSVRRWMVGASSNAGPWREVRWDGRLADGSRAPSGVYFLRLRQGAEEARQRLIWIE